MIFQKSFSVAGFLTATLLLSACDEPATEDTHGSIVINEIAGADPLVPLEKFLEPPSVQAPQISPDGTKIIYLSAVDGVSNIFVAATGDPSAARPLTHDTGRGFQATTIWDERAFKWANNGSHIIYMRDEKGDENWTLYSLNIETGDSKRLTALEGVRTRDLQLSWRFPDEVLFATNERDPSTRDYFRANIVSGEITPVLEGGDFIVILFDHNFEPRLGIKFNADLSLTFEKRVQNGEWIEIHRVPPEDVGSYSSNHINDFVGSVFTQDNKDLLGFSSEGRNAAAFVKIDASTGLQTVIGLEENVDVKRALVHPTDYTPQAYLNHFTVARWIVVDDMIREDFDYISKVADGEFTIESRSRDDQKWIISYTLSDAPTTFYVYDRAVRRATKLFTSTPQLEALPLAKMYPTVIKSSDGFDLVSYISFPTWVSVSDDGVPEHPLPTIVFIHGGPSDERAQFGFAPLLQWMVNRGYAVYVVNFRGSKGFGKAFMNAQDQEWGGKMHRDVLEQVDYIIDRGVAIPDKIALFGGSYGGYATLVGMTMTPDRFACGNAVVGPSNLETFMDPETMPPDWKIDALAKRIGDPRTPEGRALLRARSPFNFAHQTTGKMLIMQGANDVRVPETESEQVVRVMAENGVEVTYLLYPDEGHGFIRAENNISSMAISEIFFGRCLGGRYVALSGELEGSSVRVPVGAEHIPGLQEALERRADDGMVKID